MPRSKFVPEFLAKSQLVVLCLDLRWLQQATNLRTSLVVGRKLVASFLLLLNDKEICIVIGELLERDQEISDLESEFLVRCIQGEKAFNECTNLGTRN